MAWFSAGEGEGKHDQVQLCSPGERGVSLPVIQSMAGGGQVLALQPKSRHHISPQKQQTQNNTSHIRPPRHALLYQVRKNFFLINFT